MAGPMRVRLAWIGGMAVLQEGIVRWEKAGVRIWMPMFRILQAETYVKAGRDEAALRTIEQALAEGEEIGEHWAMAEALRIKARILSSAGNGKNSHDVEAILRCASGNRRVAGNCAHHVSLRAFGNARVETRQP